MNEPKPKTILKLPPDTEFSMGATQWPVLNECGHMVFPHAQPRIFFCTGAAMWEEFSNSDRAFKLGALMKAKRQSTLWLAAAFGRLALDEIEFVENGVN